ncbi:hypothetical protein SY27_17925 [Flavobacterium sp. 316]|uniref:hypothetical protein n=1 Tax=Flavobacterium sp. 316 TaxID=1603293 RepID=UPI0005DD41DF|nr:hypothetical protein [Flavobacterium sp. 316]KIX19688.1 hypothetical protein SY27_17925 [Flavobacterium sp. 316]
MGKINSIIIVALIILSCNDVNTIENNIKTKDINNKSTQSGINVYQKGKEYQAWYFLSDPDTGERIRFLKQQ